MPTRGREAPLVEKRCPAGAPGTRALASHVSCASPTATLERGFVVPASPLQELCKRRLMDSLAPVASVLASFEPAKPLGRVQRQEHHGIAAGHDVVTPPEHRAGQDP